jgi:5-methylcytosine-specific restriction endonuclease McrA
VAISKAAKAAYDREYRARNKERIAARKAAYVAQHKEQEAARVRAWIETNPERAKEIKSRCREKRAEQERAYQRHVAPKKAEYMRQYRKQKPHVWKKETAQRRRSLGAATPPWADRRALDAIWRAARSAGLHVDHIVPLRGKFVCGLNVPWNLQLLDPKANRQKGNRHAY